MLIDRDLSNALYGAVMGRNTFTAPSVYNGALADYIESNMEIYGVYSGLIDGSSDPDPLNGRVKLQMDCSNLRLSANTNNFISNLTKADPKGFLDSIVQDILECFLFLESPYSGVLKFGLDSPEISLTDLSNLTSPIDIWGMFSSSIVNSLKSMSISTVNISTSTPGSGVLSEFTIL